MSEGEGKVINYVMTYEVALVKGKICSLKRQQQHASTGIGLRFGATGSVGVGNVSHLASLHYNALPISHCHWLECSVSLPMGFFHHGCQYSLSLIFSIYHVTLDPCCVEISY